MVKIIRSAEDDREAREADGNFCRQRAGHTILDGDAPPDQPGTRNRNEFGSPRISDPEDIPAGAAVAVTKELIKVKENMGMPIIKVEYSEILRFIQEKSIVINLTNRGYIKRQPPNTYRSQWGGRGLLGTTTKLEDFASIYSSQQPGDGTFLFNKGKVYSSKAYNIPEASAIPGNPAQFPFLIPRKSDHHYNG